MTNNSELLDQHESKIKDEASGIPGLVENWDFSSISVPRWQRREFMEILIRNGHLRPQSFIVKPLTRKSIWFVYFIYTPSGEMTLAHKFTLSRLRDLGVGICVVCATKDRSLVPDNLSIFADAIFWKAPEGYDFSAYSLALWEIACHSPGADVFIMNDSVFGPFNDLRQVLDKTPWELTGFTASSQLTNHIQSYAFILRNVDRMRMLKLSSVFFPFLALSNPSDVVKVQETRLARVAARTMKVGAFWFGDQRDVIDPTLVRPFELMDAGFPFLKRSLLGKHKKFQNTDAVIARLKSIGHPI